MQDLCAPRWSKILATDVDTAQSSDKKMILAQEVIEELELPVPPWTAEKLKKRFMYKTANSTGSPQPDKNGNLDQRYKYAEQYLKILH